jgi:amidase
MQVSAPTNDVLGTLTAVEVGQHIANGDFTASESIQAAIARLKAVNPELNAVACERFEQALVDANGAGNGSAVFTGVPSFIKDNTDLQGLPTKHGSRATINSPMAKDAAFSEQFLSTGLIPIAKTNLPEFGLTATTEYSQSAPVRNPWNTNHSTGGSSGGSAALVAAGVVPIAHANDGGGSIRIPAACCGLVGLKSSVGRLVAPAMSKHLPIDIVVDGVVSRTVADTAAFYAASEQHYRNPALPALGNITAAIDKPLKIGLSIEHPMGGVIDADVLAGVEQVAKVCEGLGHKVELAPSQVSQQMADDFFLYWARSAAAINYLGKFEFGWGFDRHQLEPLTKHLSKHFIGSWWKSFSTISRLRQFAIDYQNTFNDFDLILTPTLAKPPVELGYLAMDLDFETARERLNSYAAFTPLQNVTGTPAISLPLAQSSTGLPIGVQFAAGMGQEALLLQIAYQMEAEMPWSYE